MEPELGDGAVDRLNKTTLESSVGSAQYYTNQQNLLLITTDDKNFW